MKMIQAFPWLRLIICLGLSLAMSCGTIDEGDSAPSVSLTAWLNVADPGEVAGIASDGRPVLIEFWGTW